MGGVLGSFGQALAAPLDPSTLLVLTATFAVLAGILDLTVAPPGPKRQVNETWIGQYRGWVYGGAFGAELGVGVATYIVTWLVFATLLGAMLTTSPIGGALVGGIFGVGRSLALLAAAWVDRPSRLTIFHRVMNRLGPPTRVTTASLAITVGLIAGTGVLM